MRRAVCAVVASAFFGVFLGCATPDSVKLQGDKVDRLQRQIDELNSKVEKLQGQLKK